MPKAIRPFDGSHLKAPTDSTPFVLPDELQSMPVDVEIGCGVGYHPIARALSCPDRFLVAIEHTSIKFNKFWRRYINHKRPKNLLPIHADAVSWTYFNLSPGSVSTIFLLYPNPNPKNRSKRWFCMPFMAYLISCLNPNGQIILVTNELSYFEEAVDAAEQTWKLRVKKCLTISQKLSPEHQPRSHFERKYYQRGDSLYEAHFVK